jgi:hypothetical protein
MDQAAPAKPSSDRPPEPARTSERPPRPPGSPPPGSHGRGQPRGGDEGRRRRPAERRVSGFGDEIERAVCVALAHRPPPDFPVQHRTGCATLRRLVVARRPGAVLLCDSGHPGPHRWPGDDVVLDEETTPLAAQPGPTAGT